MSLHNSANNQCQFCVGTWECGEVQDGIWQAKQTVSGVTGAECQEKMSKVTGRSEEDHAK